MQRISGSSALIMITFDLLCNLCNKLSLLSVLYLRSFTYLKKHMKNIARFIVILLFGFIQLSGCYYDVEDELYADIDCITNNVSYKGTIVPILNRHCVACHNEKNNTGGGINLDSHSEVLIYVNNTKLIASVKFQSGVSPMPPTGQQISRCEIERLENWILAGAPND